MLLRLFAGLETLEQIPLRILKKKIKALSLGKLRSTKICIHFQRIYGTS